MILEITQYGNPVLRKKCRKVTEVTDELKQFGEDLIETMVQAQGVGLAAPQVNRDIQMAVVDVSHDPECITFLKVDGEESSLDDLMPLVFINPSLEFGSLKESATEGCLSIEGINAEVRRPAQVKATLQLLDGRKILVETDGLLSRAIQHETDHLNGVLFVDRLPTATKLSMKRKLKRLTV
ncbi:MAG: peptide deformylase [Verrucomicrobiaceae bacterium TMED137]|jgi:peptide deformylase|nr:peptide deformylase [Verrucomicrobiales bacterium]MCH1498390.1 peptide deformylase [Akkermansiaceae bacterium]OUV83048.1 MAG: peptide deformylase [Verrucomicrobiaceae bacterium TMED137]MDB4628798.1 peptide deformylase [Akkermansiaceae bacterium]HAE19231.1 peptide deformylase [Verrucomicrobiales bacterium]|tara:strand:+ start:127 stop:669 length:543 start_codon:yes stop_codon:yes gene_type:complete